MSDEPIRLTQYSHGAGCGCKLAPAVLDRILHTNEAAPNDANLLVGNDSRDDAAAYDLGTGQVLLSTTDFFMPIVDDPFEFGKIASANAISDIYAMGGRPTVALSILGWPIETLPPEVARDVIAGARAICAQAGIMLAGGHSIDSPEPIFGLAVSGIVAPENLKRNDAAKPGDLLFLTKPLGVGILTTAEKRGLLRDEEIGAAAASMMRLNSVGTALGELPGVHAMTDVTGFGLLGHLGEMCAGAGVDARVRLEDVPTLPEVERYLELGAIPGGTKRNFASYGERIFPVTDRARHILCDPQTSGGLLVAVDPAAADQVVAVLKAQGLGAHTTPIGVLQTRHGEGAYITVV